MVSSALDIREDELLTTLQRLRRDYAGDPEYTALRAELPADWPI